MPTEYFTLSNGIKMPVMGLGTWLSKPDEVSNAVEVALKTGYRLIDTAYAYGNEKEIGETLKKVFAEGKIKREDVFITTKLHVQYMHYEDVIPMLKSQLESLQLSYVDLYLIHSSCAVKKVEGVKFPLENGLVLADNVDYLETWKAMEEAYKLGLTKSIGLSNFSMKQIQRVYDNATIKPHNLQLACHAYWPQNELYELCKKIKNSYDCLRPDWQSR
jgi:diketogulonate reductase-like aldo/keto reductase